MARPRTPLVAAGVVASIALGGCRCNRDHPYVPYVIDGAAPSADDAAVPAASEVDAGPFHAREATPAPPNAARMTVDGLGLDAPPERVFALALAGDFDGDGATDVAAIVVPAPAAAPGAQVPLLADGGFDAAELLLYLGLPGGGLAPPKLVPGPPPLPTDASCAPRRRLAQVGRRSFALETGSACDHHDASRWFGVFVVARGEAQLHFRATILDPSDAPALTVDADGADRDGDGLDDVALRVTVEGGGAPLEPGPKVGAVVRWLDRPAGMSRDRDEPDASFRALASAAMAKAAKPKDAPAVPRTVEQIRALYRAMCLEGGAPRLVDLLGGARALACGTSKGLEEAGLAEVRAYSVAGDALRAVAAFDRAQVPPATRTAARVTDAQGWLAQAAPVVAAPQSLRVINAVPEIERAPSPAWGALAFEPGGKLLVRTTAGVVRVDPVSGDEASAPEVAGWPSAVTSSDGAVRWLDAYDPCDGRPLVGAFGVGNETRDVPLPVVPPLGKCSGARSSAPALPVAWGPRGLEAVVAGEPIVVQTDLSRAAPSFGILDQPARPGGPRSPSGRVLVVPTSQGLLVRGARARLLRANELQGGWLELRDCAVSDDAARVACVRGGRAFVGVWAPE